MAGTSTCLEDWDLIFNSLDKPPLFANDYDVNDPDDCERLKNAMASYFTNDSIELDASCECGETTHICNRGLRCKSCDTVVEPQYAEDIETSLWIRAPKGHKHLILPYVYSVFKKNLHASHFNYFLWLIDKNYEPKEMSNSPKANADRELMQKKFGRHRTIDYFATHLMEIIEFIIENTSIITKKDQEPFHKFCKQNQHLFFPAQLALPTKLCFIVEDIDSGRYVEKHLKDGFFAIQTAAAITKYEKLNHRGEINRRVLSMLSNLASFYDRYARSLLFGKQGDYRKHIFGSRLTFTMRAVITSISGPCRYDEIRLPYGASVQLFKYHIISKLLRLGYTANDALEFVYSHVAKSCDLMNDILDEILDSYNVGLGPSSLFTRNPSLKRGSTQRLFVKIKRDVTDYTISIPNTILRAPNADFDGDEMNLTLIMDRKMAAQAERLSPSHYVRSTHEPRRITGDISLPLPVIETTVSWLNHPSYLAKIGRIKKEK